MSPCWEKIYFRKLLGQVVESLRSILLAQAKRCTFHHHPSGKCFCQLPCHFHTHTHCHLNTVEVLKEAVHHLWLLSFCSNTVIPHENICSRESLHKLRSTEEQRHRTPLSDGIGIEIWMSERLGSIRGATLLWRTFSFTLKTKSCLGQWFIHQHSASLSLWTVLYGTRGKICVQRGH